MQRQINGTGLTDIVLEKNPEYDDGYFDREEYKLYQGNNMVINYHMADGDVSLYEMDESGTIADIHSNLGDHFFIEWASPAGELFLASHGIKIADYPEGHEDQYDENDDDCGCGCDDDEEYDD